MKPKVLCDTNVIIEIFKGNMNTIREIEIIGFDNIAISSITTMEMYHGALNKVELKKINKYLNTIEIFHIDIEISKTAIDLIEKYSKSHNLQIPDALIAAT